MEVEELLDVIIRELVARPDYVKIDRINDDRGVLLSVHVAKSDMPIVIGREGKLVGALRTIMRARGSRDNARVSVRIEED